jgi:DNA repair exonuclease SbcCD ATPase subunit
MTRDEIVTALRQCPRYGVDCSKGVCAFFKPNGAFEDCIKKKNDAAADLIENQQRHIEALLQANAALRDTVLRRDAQIEKMSAELADARNEIKKFYNGYDQLDASNNGLMAANENLAADRKALINELCQYCGKYKYAHEGACYGCRWREM